MPDPVRKLSAVRIALILIFAVTCFRLWFSTRVGLVADEAYYWLWSKHLAASYRDKGPAIAWIIALGTQMFGDTVFGIRFFAVLFSSAVGWMVFDFARRLFDDRVAMGCLLTALVTPLLAIGSILMTIDTPSVFFWGLGAILFWKALSDGKTLTWFWVGLAVGAGFLAKFTNGVQLLCFGLFLLWSRERRPLLFSRQTLVMLAAFLLAVSPVIWWNIQTGWVHAAALHSRSGVTGSFQIHPGQLFRFIGEQFGVYSPLLTAGMVVAAVALACRRDSDERARFLVSQFAPVYGLFLFFSLNSAGKPNWTAPAYFTGVILTVVFWRDLAARRPGWRWANRAALGIAALMTLFLHNSEVLGLPRRLDPMRRAQGWPDFAGHLQKIRVGTGANLLLGSDYSIASLMAFYLPDQPVTYLPPAPYGSSQFTLWPDYRVTPQTKALFVAWEPGPAPEVLQKQFNRIQLMEDFWTLHHGRPMKRICVYLCSPE